MQTYHSDDRYGRVYAAYAGVFLIGAMIWGWIVDGNAPDPFDWLGAFLILLGVTSVLWGRHLSG